jgi:rubrerythrin
MSHRQVFKEKASDIFRRAPEVIQMEDDSAFSKRQRRLFLIFKMAIESERAAQARYKQAQKYCDDPALKKVLQGIEREEATHEKALARWYARLKKRIGGERASS